MYTTMVSWKLDSLALFGRDTKHLFSTVNHNQHNVDIKMLFVTIDTTAKVLWGYAILRQRIQKTHADYGF